MKEIRIPETDVHYYVTTRWKLRDIILGSWLTKYIVFFDMGIILEKFIGWYFDEYDRKIVLQYNGEDRQKD